MKGTVEGLTQILLDRVALIMLSENRFRITPLSESMGLEFAERLVLTGDDGTGYGAQAKHHQEVTGE